MKILVGEDDHVYSRILEKTLTKWGYEVITCCDGREVVEELEKEHAPNLLMIDWMMPVIDGVEICKTIRQAKKEPFIYIILLTSKDRKTDIVEGLAAGADDYVIKPFHIEELQARLRAGRRILELQDRLIASREAIRTMATYDALTGVLNRGAIMEALTKKLSQAVRENSPLAVVMLDIDHFKQVNDKLGHMAGDAVLRETASRLKASLRPYDEIGRYGGEEFLVILPGCDSLDALKQAERLRAFIGEKPMNTSEGMLTVTISLGLTAINESTTETDLLVKIADKALYLAKNNGRNRVEFL